MVARYTAEVFGFPVDNRSAEAEAIRQQHQCPFVNLVQRYQPAFTPGSPNINVFAVYDLVRETEIYALTLKRFVSASVDALFTALCQNPNIPSKDEFITKLQAKVEQGKPHLQLDVHF